MNLNTLRYVVTISEVKNITKAAKILYVSQSSLSQSLQSLEKQLGILLFDRTKSPLEPTYAGLLYIEWAKQVLDSENQLLKRLSDIASDKQRKLTIGLSPQKSIQIFPEIIQEFYSQVSGCTITLEEHPSNELISLLESGKIDLLFDILHPELTSCQSIAIAEERLLIAASDKYKFKSVEGLIYPRIDLKELKEKPIITLASDQYLGKIFKDLFAQLYSFPSIALECRSAEMAHIMVSKGIGITLIPEFSTHYHKYDNVNYYVLNEPKLSRTMGVTYIKSHYLSYDANKLIEIIKNTLLTY